MSGHYGPDNPTEPLPVIHPDIGFVPGFGPDTPVGPPHILQPLQMSQSQPPERPQSYPVYPEEITGEKAQTLGGFVFGRLRRRAQIGLPAPEVIVEAVANPIPDRPPDLLTKVVTYSSTDEVVTSDEPHVNLAAPFERLDQQESIGLAIIVGGSAIGGIGGYVEGIAADSGSPVAREIGLVATGLIAGRIVLPPIGRSIMHKIEPVVNFFRSDIREE